jgi:histidinol-phosphate/aromatic aminotransferase/cobyric acid decarboxylase-like protein
MNDTSIRPLWYVPEPSYEKLDLSGNVCIDRHIPKFEFDQTVYDDPAISYNALSKYHQVECENLVIGLGLSELICRIMYVVKLNGWSMTVADIPTWQPVEAMRLALDIPSGSDVLYVADPNGNNGMRGNVDGKYKLIIRDKSYADFMGDTTYDIEELTIKTLSKSIAMPGVRFGWGIGPRSIINQIQSIRPARVTVGGMGNSLPEILSNIAPHISRMNAFKMHIESNYECFPSLGNYVLFKELPKWSDRVIMKHVGKYYRMSLVGMDIFYDKIDRD